MPTATTAKKPDTAVTTGVTTVLSRISSPQRAPVVFFAARDTRRVRSAPTVIVKESDN